MSRSEVRATVVYEDARRGNAPFGLHRFIVAVVARRTGRSHYQVTLKDMPAGGAMKIVDKLSEDYAPGGEPMLVLLDGDRAAQLLACEDSDAVIRDALEQRAQKAHGPRQARFEVFVLRLTDTYSNTEGLIATIQSLAPTLVPAEVFQRALDKKPADRDTVFQEFARQSADVQDRLLEKAPALGHLVARAEALVRSAPSLDARLTIRPK